MENVLETVRVLNRRTDSNGDTEVTLAVTLPDGSRPDEIGGVDLTTGSVGFRNVLVKANGAWLRYDEIAGTYTRCCEGPSKTEIDALKAAGIAVGGA